MLPADLPWSKLSHNLAILPHKGVYLIVGGTHNWIKGYRAPFREPWNNGIYIARGSSWCLEHTCQQLRLDVDSFPSWNRSEVQWQGLRKLMNGSHPGCVEVRTTHRGGLCEFDGRLSLVHFKNQFLLYARANAGFRNPKGMNGRFVQVTSSTDLESWSPFELVGLPGWSMHTNSTSLSNIYFFGVQQNPVHANSLLAVYPLTHLGKGCIAMSISDDGLRWSRPAPLHASAVDTYRVRTTIHPASPGLVRLGEHVFLYLHMNVPGVTNARGAPKLVRFAVSVAELHEWSISVLRDPANFQDW